MTTIRIPTPLRAYTDGLSSIQIQADTVQSAMQALVTQYPTLEQHLYDETGELRAYVNLFVNEHDVRALQGAQTELNPDDQLKIIPSIAGGLSEEEGISIVDHSALRVNQAAIITLTIGAFVIDAIWLVALVGGIMLVGSLLGRPGFITLYHGFRRAGLVKPDKLLDHREPHRFAQTVGGAFLAGATTALLAGATIIGWTLAWIVVSLAALNLFGGFCVGCAAYYWLGRLGWPGFRIEPPPGTAPGHKATHRPGS